MLKNWIIILALAFLAIFMIFRNSSLISSVNSIDSEEKNLNNVQKKKANISESMNDNIDRNSNQLGKYDSIDVKSGIFLDSAVAGLYYLSGKQSGYTDENGSFKYEQGEKITFKIGDIVIGSTEGKEIMTPLDLVPEAIDCKNRMVSNILRFLQTLDEDENPDNGIFITEKVSEHAQGKQVDFSESTFETTIQTIINDLDDDDSLLIPAKEAESHFRCTLLTIPGSEIAKKVQEIIDNEVAEREIPGVVVSFLNSDGRKWISTSGFSDLKNKTPMLPNTKFRIGSISKTFIGMSILQLVQEGKLMLDDPIKTRLPEDVVAKLEKKYNTADITIRHLMTHFSGIGDYLDNFDDWFKPFYTAPEKRFTDKDIIDMAVEVESYIITEQTIMRLKEKGIDENILELLEQIKGVEGTEQDLRTVITEMGYGNISADIIQMILANSSPAPVHPPGDNWDYSNTNYIILAMILEKATGNAWRDEVENRFIKPLDLKDTFIPKTGELEIPGNYAHGYLDLYALSLGLAGKKGEPLTDYTKVDPSFTGASGNIFSSAEDMSRWIRSISEGELLNDNMQHILLTSFININPVLAMGLGLVKRLDYGTIGHPGAYPGYECSIQYHEKNRIAMTLCMNRTLPGGKKSCTIILFEILSILSGDEKSVTPESHNSN